MKISMYFNYTSRSLLRGGQRTILAIFCVAVGVMAIVALQLVGVMLQNAVTSNIRDLNGGDISATAQNKPFTTSDLTFFNQLKNNGTISNYTAISAVNGGLSAATPSFQQFPVNAVDPTTYPLVSAPTFEAPNNGQIANLLTNNQVIVTQNFLDRYNKKVGDSFDVYIKLATGSGSTIHVTLAGVIANSGGFAQSGNLLLISNQDYQAADPISSASYSSIGMITSDAAHTISAAKAITRQFPLASTQTVADVLKQQQASLDQINSFLEIAGLLALLIGGIGIINTMQVLLSRRKTEIATLKTVGYRRIDLTILFGLEASLLGLIGGIVGAAAAIGVSYIVRMLVINLGITIVFQINPWTLAGGVAIGFGSALIFGLMPIVQAANIRPLSVIREMPAHKSVSSSLLTVILLVVFSVLFCGLAIIILKNNVLLGVEVVYGTFAFLLLLGLFFSLIMLVISKLPVPNHINFGFVALALGGIIVSALLYLLLPVFGIILLTAVLLGVIISLSTSSWKVSMKMALRNIGRRRTRTTTTAVALFVGIFTIGLVVALGQDLQALITKATNQSPYNIITITTGTDSSHLNSQLTSIPGLSKSYQDTFTAPIPVAINDKPLQQLLPTDAHRSEVLRFLGLIEGYNLTSTQPSGKMTQGRNLNASDVGTNNILVSDQLGTSGSDHMNLKPGDTITYTSIDGKTQKTLTIVGVYNSAVSISQVGFVLAPSCVPTALSPASVGASTITYMEVDTAKVNSALDTIGGIAPNANVRNTADIMGAFAQQLNSLVDILVAIASLSMMAGVIIIANSVALAMLERRRELGILKSVGYTSGTVMREVLIENGIIGTIGAFVALLLVAAGVTILGQQLFHIALTISPWIVVALVGGSTLLAMATAAFIAWSAVRVRPLEVLRYE